MNSKVRATGKLYNPTVHATQSGASLYSFSMQVSNQDKKTQEWHSVFLPVTLFDQNGLYGWLMDADKKEITFEGSLTVKKGFTRRDGTEVADHIGLFGFDASLGEKLTKTAPQQPIQAPKAPEPVPTQAQTAQSGGYENDFPEQAETVPF